MPSRTDAPQAKARVLPLASITDEIVKPSGILWRKIATKMIQPSAWETRNRDAIEEGVYQQPDQNGISFVRMDELIGVGFFPKMEMRGDRVLKKMDEQVSAEDEKSGVRTAQIDALRDHLDQRRRQHEACTEGDEVAQVGALPMLLDDDGAAKHICARRRQSQQQTGQDGRHEGKEYQEAMTAGFLSPDVPVSAKAAV